MSNTRNTLYVLAAAGLLIAVVMVKLMLRFAETAPANQTRIEERLRILAEVQATNDYILNEYAWQNQAKGIVRVPIERAKELTVSEWQNPAKGRSNLLALAAKAFAPTPKPPEPVNPYE